ncbi:MAG: hypothetical protein JWQ64_1270 [Subtercola sp.]|jgi:hypothetical protein|nr:hypothetical protein [Subtercola sp.]
MAEIVLGIATSHGPMLNTPPDQWGQRAKADERNKELIYKGESYDFETLKELRGGGSAFTGEITQDVWDARHAACRAAITQLGDIIRNSDVDVLVVVSSDHKEIFGDELLPQFAIYWGDTAQHVPYTEEQLAGMPPGLAIAEVANQPTVTMTRTMNSELALHLIRETSDLGFDPAASGELPAGEWGSHSIPHGWGFIYQQVLDGSGEIPFVPVFVNTFWEPNPPSASRSYDFGVALGKAIRSFPGDIKVGVVASGGLTHMVVDEDVDRPFLDALVNRDEAHMRALPSNYLRSGTSELRNWIVTAAALEDTDLQARVIDYQPCYRSEAGTGCAMGFVAWDSTRA